MEVHAAAAPAVGKRLWSYVRAALFMARNGVLSLSNNKRKLLRLTSRMHLLKRKGVINLLSSHHATTAYALRRRRRRDYEYEFSCTNSPADPAYSIRRRLAYFPCLGAVAEEEHEYRYQYDAEPEPEPEPPLNGIDIEYYASSAAAASSLPGLLLRDLDLAPAGEEDGEQEYACAPASPALLLDTGEFSVRVSDYSSEDEGVGNQAVDADAEEFIRRFYDQLRRQNAVALLPYYMQQREAAIAAA